MPTSAAVTVFVTGPPPETSTSTPVTVTVTNAASATSSPVTVTALNGSTSSAVRVTVISGSPVDTDTSSPVVVTVLGSTAQTASAGQIITIPAFAANGTISTVTLTGVTPAPTLNGSGGSGTDRWFRAPILAAQTDLTFTVTDTASTALRTTITVKPAYDRVRWGGAMVLSYRTVITGAGIPQVAPTASFDAFPSSGLAPLTVQFTDTTTGVPTSWSWAFSDGTTSTTRNPIHTFTAGTWTATLTATNTFGSSTSLPSTITSSAPPPAGGTTYGSGSYGSGPYGH